MTALMERKVKERWGPFLRSCKPKSYALPRRGSRSAHFAEGGAIIGEVGGGMLRLRGGCCGFSVVC